MEQVKNQADEARQEGKKPISIIGMKPLLFAVFTLIVLVSMLLGALPEGLTGAFAVCIALAAILDFIGEHLPIVRSFLGGGAFVCIFGSSALVYFHLIPKVTVDAITKFTLSPTNFLDYGIVVLIAGSLLGVDRNTLKSAIVRYMPCVIACQVGAIAMVSLLSFIVGYDIKEAIFFVALPVLGGGIGAGAIPMSKIVGEAWSTDTSTLLAQMVPSIALANAFAIIGGGLMNRLGKAKPSWSGDGKLIANSKLKVSEDKMPKRTDDFGKLGIGLFTSVVLMCIGSIINHFVPIIHAFAWMIIICCIVKIAAILPTYIEEACYQWSQLFIKNFSKIILVILGISQIKLDEVFAAVTPVRLVLILGAVVAGCVFAMIVGKLIGFYPIEAGITTGLCSTDMGGTGDIAILGAARRLELLPYSAISTRIGGAVILILSGFLARLLM